MIWRKKIEMLFDVDIKLVKTLMREQHVGARDLIVKSTAVGPNEVTFVSAKSMRGLDFVKELEAKLPKVTLEWGDEDEDDEEDQGDLGDEEELGEEEEDDLGDEDDEELED